MTMNALRSTCSWVTDALKALLILAAQLLRVWYERGKGNRDAVIGLELQRMADAFPGIPIERVESNGKAKRKGRRYIAAV
jgi:hypothetical protein